MGNITAVTDAEFEAQVLKSDKPVLVDFWAEWCGPCRQVAPILDEIAPPTATRSRSCKMNVDENPVTPSSYRVTGIPTINVYQGGEVVKSIVGARPKAALLNELADYIALTPAPAAASARRAPATPRRLVREARVRASRRRGAAAPVRGRRTAPTQPLERGLDLVAASVTAVRRSIRIRGVRRVRAVGLEPDAARKSAGTTHRPARPRRVAERLDRAGCPAADQVAGHALHQHPAQPAAARTPGSTYAVVSSTASGETGAVGKRRRRRARTPPARRQRSRPARRRRAPPGRRSPTRAAPPRPSASFSAHAVVVVDRSRRTGSSSQNRQERHGASSASRWSRSAGRSCATSGLLLRVRHGDATRAVPILGRPACEDGRVRQIRQSQKLQNVRYDVRGPILRRGAAARGRGPPDPQAQHRQPRAVRLRGARGDRRRHGAPPARGAGLQRLPGHLLRPHRGRAVLPGARAARRRASRTSSSATASPS